MGQGEEIGAYKVIFVYVNRKNLCYYNLIS